MSVIALNDNIVTGLQNDPSLWIAEGRSRFDVAWKNKQIRWSMLLARLRKATMTQETQSEYLAMTKNQQDTIKDVGGFVGGTLSDGHRKSETVKDRTLVTFDLDKAPKDLIEWLDLNAPYAWALYSTHKHRPEAPRFRLIAPLSRAVSPEEYEAITRKMAEEIGLQYFDATTFQASRLMYWPSYSRDGEYIFEYNDGRDVEADKVLASYPDWRDVSFWPICPDELRVNKKKKTDRQADPLQKKGPVGVFCRTYDIPAAIAQFLPEIYTTTEKGDRYTYAKGSTFGGMVVYDDGKFCYSNHSTDPAHGQDLNAFDLVRIHLFGEEDQDELPGTAAKKLPSYKSMLDLISHDRSCIVTYEAERRAQLADDFADEPAEGAADPDEWKYSLDRNENNGIKATITNLVKIFSLDPELSGLRFNELSGFIDITKPVPWKKELTEWKNSDDSCLYIYLAQNYAKFGRQDVADALIRKAGERKFNPIRDYLKALPEWDGKPRMETLFVDYLGAEDSIYTREATKRWLLAAVSRALRPGCKFDYVPVLSGPGGIGKSTLAARLGGDWFSDSLSLEDMKDKTAAEKIQGNWILEIGELKGMRKVDVESVKSFMSRQVDNYRPSYGRSVESHPRSCVFIGTSNSGDYLRDVTGNRRFWPIETTGNCSMRPWDLSKEEVGQIWAEVMFYYDTVEERQLTLSKEADVQVQAAQIGALEYDERSGLVDKYLNQKLPKDWEEKDVQDRRFWLNDAKPSDGDVDREDVSVMEIWAECFGKNPADKKRSDSDDIAKILLQLGWTRERKARRNKLYGVQKVYRKL